MRFVKSIVGVLVLVFSVSCANQMIECQQLDRKESWDRLSTPPSFVTNEILESMYFSGIPPDPEELIWYSNTIGQFAACNPGNEHGCGEHVVIYEKIEGGIQKVDGEKLVVCAAN